VQELITAEGAIGASGTLLTLFIDFFFFFFFLSLIECGWGRGLRVEVAW